MTRKAKILLATVVLAVFVVAPSQALATDLEGNPPSYDFGNQDIHATSPQTNIDFTNNGGSVLNVSAASLNGPDASSFNINADSCGGATLNPGDGCTVTISFSPTTVGAKSASLDVPDDLPETASVPLSGTGATGTVSPSSDPVNFGPQPWYYGSQYNSVNITNTGSYAVQFTASAISGAGAALFSMNYDGCNGQTVYPGNSCNVGMYFNPTAPVVADATLTVNSDATNDPLSVGLHGVALSGGHAVITPSSHAFGDVAVGGASAAQTFTVANDGDADFQVQQILVLSGTPQYFPVTDDTCAGSVVAAGSSCHFTVTFQPGAAGLKEASLFMIAGNLPQPVTTIGVSGTGLETVTGSATIEGTPQVGSKLTCKPAGFPESARFSYGWLADGKAIAGETASTYVPTNSVIGKRITCRLTATNAVSTITVDSPPTGPVQARSLIGLPGAISGPTVCRSVKAPKSVEVGSSTVRIGQTRPVTPQAPLSFSSSGRAKLSLAINGSKTSSGRGAATLTPRDLDRYDDGQVTVTVSRSGSSADAKLVLAGCPLAVSFAGGPGQTTRVNVSARQGASSVKVALPRGLRLRTARRVLGQISVRSYGSPAQSFGVFGANTASNGIHVSLSRRSISVSGLPADTGVIALTLQPGVVRGHAGTVTATSKPSSAGSAKSGDRAQTPAVWRR